MAHAFCANIDVQWSCGSGLKERVDYLESMMGDSADHHKKAFAITSARNLHYCVLLLLLYTCFKMFQVSQTAKWQIVEEHRANHAKLSNELRVREVPVVDSNATFMVRLKDI